MTSASRQPLLTVLERYPALASCKDALWASVEAIIACYEKGGKLLVCGNGGSASDSQHIVGELMKAFVLPRKLNPTIQKSLRDTCPGSADTLIAHLQGALPAISLVSETALSTAYANDVAPELCFAQQVLGYGNPGDILWGISTSGNSANVLYAAQVAKAKGLTVIGMTGQGGGKLKEWSDICIAAPSAETYQIQEYHLPLYHAICLAVEAHFFS